MGWFKSSVAATVIVTLVAAAGCSDGNKRAQSGSKKTTSSTSARPKSVTKKVGSVSVEIPAAAFADPSLVKVSAAPPQILDALGTAVENGSISMDAGGQQPAVPVAVSADVGDAPEPGSIPIAYLVSADGSKTLLEAKWDQTKKVATAQVPHFSNLSFLWTLPSKIGGAIKEAFSWWESELTGAVKQPECVGKAAEVLGATSVAAGSGGVNTDKGVAWACATPTGYELYSSTTIPLRVDVPEGATFTTSRPDKLWDRLAVDWAIAALKAGGDSPNVLYPGQVAKIELAEGTAKNAIELVADGIPWTTQALSVSMEVLVTLVAPQLLGSDELAAALFAWNSTDCFHTSQPDRGSNGFDADQLIDTVAACLPAIVDVVKAILAKGIGAAAAVVLGIGGLAVAAFRLMLGAAGAVVLNVKAIFNGDEFPGASLVQPAVPSPEPTVPKPQTLDVLPAMDPSDEAEVRKLLEPFQGNASACQYWDVFGVDLGAGDIDVSLWFGAVLCGGDTYGDLIRIRGGREVARYSYSDEAALAGHLDDFYAVMDAYERRGTRLWLLDPRNGSEVDSSPFFDESGKILFSAFGGNVMCVLSDNGISCQNNLELWPVTQDEAAACDRAVGKFIKLDADGVTFPCMGGSIGPLEPPPALPVGQTLVQGNLGCGVGEQFVSCWNDETGTRFDVSETEVMSSS